MADLVRRIAEEREDARNRYRALRVELAGITAYYLRQAEEDGDTALTAMVGEVQAALDQAERPPAAP